MAAEPKYVSDSDELSVRDLILSIRKWVRYLWSKRWVLLIAGILGAVVGLVYSILKIPQYTAITTFVLESGDSKGGLGRLAGVAAVAGIDLGADAGGIFQGDNILELYKSRTIVAQALLSKTHPDSNELLIERYINFNGFLEAWADQPDLLALDFRHNPATLTPKALRKRDSLLTNFVNAINKDVLRVEKPERGLSIFRVEVTSPDEVFSKSLNENLVRDVSDFYTQTKTKKSIDNIRLLEAKVDSVRAVMSGAIYSAAKVSDATPNLNPTRQVQRIAPAQEAQFSAETNKSMLAQLLQNLEIAKMNLMQEQPLIQLVDRPVYPLKVDRLGKFKGIVIGGFLFGFFSILILIASKYYREIMVGDSGDIRVQEVNKT